MKKFLLVHLFLPIAALEIGTQLVYSAERSGNSPFYSGCSIISLSKGDRVFFGGNDDYINPDSYYWVEPGDSSQCGVIWIGTPDNPQQGINEKGLAYDANGLPKVDLNPHSERIAVKGTYYHQYVMQIMHECTRVEEVISWANLHQHLPYMHDQLHFADATGDAVIISAGAGGELVFTRKPAGDGFLVSTNFNVANPSNGYGYPCWRYDKARELLGPLLKTTDPLTIGDVTAVLDAVHLEKGSSWTIETMVADLVHGEVYLYYFFQYDRPVVLQVKNELANPREPGPLSKLFPEDVQKEAASRYQTARANLRTNRVAGISWPAILLVSLIVLLLNRSLFTNGFRFWITAVLFLGPVALLAGFIALRTCKTDFCRNAIIETLGSLIPIVVSYTAVNTILILSMLSGNVSMPVQFSMMFGLPLLLGLVFHTAFLAPVSHTNAGRFFNQCLPLVLVTNFLGLGGIFPIAMPLVIKSLNMSLLIPLSPLAVLTWWVIVVLGALPGGCFIFLFQRRAIKKGFRSWSVLTAAGEDIRLPEWGKLWWWILISIGILLAGLFIGGALVKN